MKRDKYILLLLAISTMWSCQAFDEDFAELNAEESSANIEVLEDGRLKVTAQLEGLSMTSVETRASVNEDVIYNGWCLIFGQDQTNYSKQTGDYSDYSPLIQIEPVTVNANGVFTMIFDEYADYAFMRIVTNLTTRENEALTDIVSWRKVLNAYNSNNEYDDDNGNDLADAEFDVPPTTSQVKNYGIATFGQYRYQSVGLDGIYNMTYNTKTTIHELATSYTDVSGISTNWLVTYSNNDSGAQTGVSSILSTYSESYNSNQPNPASPTANGFPMASYGFVMNNISEESLAEIFGSTVYMIRACSKVQVAVSDSTFSMDEVYLIDAAQESRIRSTVLSYIDGESTTGFAIPVDLGGTITYEPLAVNGATTSDPIYFYPNSGDDYDYNSGAVDQTINPQYIIIKGQSNNYDTPGYYKVAIKAQYPLVSDPNPDNADHWSELTYDILRNTSFTVNLLEIDKPGYKTFEDAADENSPANNISYSITIDTSDNRYEVLVSKGTYYAELETSRVYIKGYMDEGIKGCYIDFSMTPSIGNTVPTVYVQSNGYKWTDDDCTIAAEDYSSSNVGVTHCLVLREGDDGYADDGWDNSDDSKQRIGLSTNGTGDGLSDYLVEIPSSSKATKVRVYFDAADSGRIRLRIGDILKFIPITYDRIPISIYGTKGQDGTDESDQGVVVTGNYGTTWNDFSWSKIEYDTDYETDDSHIYDPYFLLLEDGTIENENTGVYEFKPELRARIYPKDAGDGNAVLYLRQASDFKLMNGDSEILDDTQIEEGNEYYVIFNSQSVVKENETEGLFTGAIGSTSVVFDATTSSSNAASVDAVTLSIETEITTDTTAATDGSGIGSKVVWENYFNSVFSEDNQILTLSADIIDYNIYDEVGDDLDVSEMSGSDKGDERERWLTNSVRPYLVTYENTATSVVRVTNVAGDYKEYTVKQTQYPPVYLVDSSGELVKQFRTSSGGTSGATVFVLNLWNYDESVEGYTQNWRADYTYNYYSGSLGIVVYDGLLCFRTVMLQPFTFDKSFISSYKNWGSSNDYSTKSIDGKTLLNVASTVTPAEMWLIGGDKYADSIIGMVRNTNYISYTLNSYNYYTKMEITIDVTDKYGDTYSTTKKLYGATDSWNVDTQSEWDTHYQASSSVEIKYASDSSY